MVMVHIVHRYVWHVDRSVRCVCEWESMFSVIIVYNICIYIYICRSCIV